MEWTSEQLKAIGQTGRMTVLSAAAGSGKTRVLVEKAVRIILDEENRCDADRLLIVTFSNASAAEFKDRITKRLNERMRRDPSNPYLRSQKMKFSRRDVSTIHAFCIKLVRENFRNLDLTVDFTIADEVMADSLHEKAIDEAMMRGYGKKDFNDLVSFYGRSSDDSAVRTFLRSMDTYFSALPDPRGRLLGMLDDYGNSSGATSSEAYLWMEKHVEKKTRYMERLVGRMEEIYSLGTFTGYERGIAAYRSLSGSISSSIAKKDYAAAALLASDSLPRIGTAKPGCAESEAVKAVRDAFKSEKDSLASLLGFLDPDRCREDIDRTLPYVSVLVDTFLDYQDTLMELKKEKRQFEFSDFEHFAYSLLMDREGRPTDLCLELRDRYEYVMEDEFQDTSYIQDAIFRRIAREGESNLFVVGDIKQSIYRFRKASPEIFYARRQRGLDSPETASTIFLPHNFRSEAAVIDGVNYLFRKLMSRECGGVEYDRNEELKTLKEPSDGVGVSFRIYDTDEVSKNVSLISRMISSGMQVKDGGEARPARPGDFCILMRNSRKIPEYRKQLEALGFEVYVRDDEPVLRKPEIECVINMLRIINNPSLEIYLSRTMFGDMFDFTLDEILKLRFPSAGERKTRERVNLFTALRDRQDERCKDFLATLHDLVNASRILSMDKLIDYICRRTGYYRRLAFSADGSEKRENLRWFIDFARRWRITHSSDLPAFLRNLDIYLAREKSVPANSVKGENAIGLMTIHASKGLEFPVVFVTDLGRRMNTRDTSARLVFDTELGIGMYANVGFGLNRSTLNVRAIQEKVRQELMSEEMRLYYVAFTRAKDLLVITCEDVSKAALTRAVSITSSRPDSMYLSSRGTADEWMLSALSSHPAVRQLSGLAFESGSDIPSCISVEVDDKVIPPESNAFVGEVREEMEDADMNLIMSNMAYEYPHRISTLLPIKMSVSEISKHRETILAVPRFTMPDRDSVSAAEKGTAMHRMAQYIDIRNARQDLEKELAEMASRGIIDPDLVDMKMASAFVHSSLSDEMLRADRIFREQEFLVPYPADLALDRSEYAGNEILIQGVMDCVLQYGDEIVVVDYKTDRIKDMNELAQRYSRQLELYRYAARLLYGHDRVRCVIYSFRLDDTVEV